MTEWLDMATTEERQRELARHRHEVLRARHHRDDFDDRLGRSYSHTAGIDRTLAGRDFSISEAATVNQIADRVRQQLHELIDDGPELDRLWDPDDVARAIALSIARTLKSADRSKEPRAEEGQTIHIICEARDNATMPLVRYHRIILRVCEQ